VAMAVNAAVCPWVTTWFDGVTVTVAGGAVTTGEECGGAGKRNPKELVTNDVHSRRNSSAAVKLRSPGSRVAGNIVGVETPIGNKGVRGPAGGDLGNGTWLPRATA